MFSSNSMAKEYIDGYEQKTKYRHINYFELPVMENIGSVENFQSWCIEQPCILTGCEGCNEFVPIQGIYGLNHYLGVPLTASAAILFENMGAMGLLKYYLPQCVDMTASCAYAWFVLEAKRKIMQWCSCVQKH